MDINEAMALHQAGRIEEANAAYRVLVTQAPDNSAAQHLLGVTFLQLGRPQDAVEWIARALSINARDPGAHSNLGLALQALGRTEEAVGHYEQAIAIEPTFAFAHNNLGLALAALDRQDAAVRSYERALEIEPAYAEAHYNLGNALMALNRHADAVRCYEQALELEPGRAEVHYNLANALAGLGRHDEAIRFYEQALAILPGDPDTLTNLGNALAALNRHAEAAACHEKALAIDPGRAESHYNLGNALTELGRHEEAIRCYEYALAIQPRHADACNSLGNALLALNRDEEAMRCFERAVAEKPDYLHARIQHLHLCGQAALWRAGEERDLLAQLPARPAGPGEISAFPFLHFVESPAMQRKIAALHAGGLPRAGAGPVVSSPLPSGAGERIRVAYFSGDFRAHPVSYLTAELFELHDRSRFDVTLLSYGPDDGSPMRKRIEAAGRFIDLRGLPRHRLRDTILAQRPDILVDLQGYTSGSLTELLAQRLAPVQVSWLGYPGTLGADFIDYIVADPFVVPAGAEAFYSEKIIRLPDTFQPNDRRRRVADPRTRSEYGLPEKGTVLCCFNQTAKIRESVFHAWAEVLRRVPGSVLWLSGKGPAAANLRQHASAQGIDPQRIVFGDPLPYEEHLARYRVADLALDTYPFGSGTTGSDALWAGCPLVALTGEAFASRMAGSLLTGTGLTELVTHDLAEYTRLIVDLAGAPGPLAAIREKLARNLPEARLFDTPRLVRNLENAYAAVMKRARTGLPPDHIGAAVAGPALDDARSDA